MIVETGMNATVKKSAGSEDPPEPELQAIRPSLRLSGLSTLSRFLLKHNQSSTETAAQNYPARCLDMRRLPLATLLLTIATLLAGGCQQTAGTATPGPMTPIGPLAPVGAGQAPALAPFGGSTKVTPPATGSYVAPNNYMGGVVPEGQAAVGTGSRQGFAAQGNNVIGSGVQVAGWNETNSVVAGTQPAPVGQAAPPTSTFGAAPPSAGNPRSGGMQVIDLTGAPAPPGYRPTVPSPASQYPVAPQPQTNWQQAPPSQSPQNRSFQNQQNPGTGVLVIPAPAAGEIADRLMPIPSSPGSFQPSPSSSQTNVPRTATAPIPGPSTEPLKAGNPNGSQQNLPWRQPGTQF
jgi:hypothetical protein